MDGWVPCMRWLCECKVLDFVDAVWALSSEAGTGTTRAKTAYLREHVHLNGALEFAFLPVFRN